MTMMEKLVSVQVLNSTLDWDETAYNVFHHLYNIHLSADGARSFLNDELAGFGNHTKEQNSTDVMEARFSFVVEGIGMVFVALLGMIGNLISAWILSRPKMRSSINRLLLGLAAADTVYITVSTLVLGLPTILSYMEIDFSVLILLTPMLFPVAVISNTASVYLTLAVAAERYVAVGHPLRARSNFTWKQAGYVVFGITTFATLYNVSRWLEYSVGAVVDSENNVIRYIPVSTSLRRNPAYEKYFVFVGYFIFLCMLPLIALIVFNVLIYRAVKRASQERTMMSTSERSEAQLARMLIMVVLVFILCNAFSLVGIALKVITGSPTLFGVDSLRNFFINFNSSINFVIYCAYGKRFRDMFVEMLPDRLSRLCCNSRRKGLERVIHAGSGSTDINRRLSGASIIGSSLISRSTDRQMSISVSKL